MRILSGSVAIVLALVVILFAVSNRQPVELGLWPLDGRIVVPLFVPVLVCGFATFVIGGVVSWISGSRWRRLARRRGHRVQELEARLRQAEERPAATDSIPRRQAPALRQIPGGRN